MSEIHPCPFCGKPPVFLTITENGDFDRCYEIRCDHCGIEISEEYKDDTISRWNTRTAPVVYVPVDQIVINALSELSGMYSRAWDKADGGLMMMHDDVERFEHAHDTAQKALASFLAVRPALSQSPSQPAKPSPSQPVTGDQS